MKVTYTFRCRNGYGENITFNFDAYNFFSAENIALNWLKQHYIRQGWLVNHAGRRFFISW